MMWGVEQSGPLRSFRVMQKRGVIIDSEDYLPITGTYEEHPLSKVVPKARNMDELKQLRRQEYINSIDQNTKAHESRQNAYKSTERPYIRSEFLADKTPDVTSIHQRRQQSRIEARRRQGLTDELHD